MQRWQLGFCSRATAGALCIGMLLACPSLAQTESQTTKLPQSQTAASTPTSQPQVQPPLTPERCLVLVRDLEPEIPKWMEGAKSAIQMIIPNPQAYEKTLPPIEKVLADKDKLNLKNYGGLAEAYLYNGDEAACQKLYSIFVANSKQILGVDDAFPAGVTGDIGLYYFNKHDYTRATPLITESTSQFESHLTPANSNSLLADYICMTLIRDKAGNKTEAEAYAKKTIDLVLKQRQQMK
jgi:hypothetical protein